MGVQECPCKYRLVVTNETGVTVTVTPGVTPAQEEPPNGFVGNINFTAIQCFTGAAMCNPAVDNFEMNFVSNGNTINLVQGRRGTIACVEDTQAFMFDGTALGTGNAIPMQQYTVDFSYTILNDTASVTITATGEDGTIITTTFIADVSPATFIGDCEDMVGGGMN
ncbi:hypothetical protein [Bacillus sp. B15-48]|uniref:hypothetical protein n=1 Tax=Bacillus sp. B15-48 TaxID=1548601 RepID=UPI00193F9FEB|nr:hypothetical protein [Bacillus sp. B15-48]MBM4760810.1 hypothetical protein [Bacillus sp. B15-48]